jgi:large subunit ribosomal protein L18e
MVKRTGPTNENLRSLINNLKKEKMGFWRAIAKNLEKPRRIRRTVNLSRINRNTKKGDKVIIPGKILGSGELSHDLTIIALEFSEAAKLKIKKSGSDLISIRDFYESKKPVKGVRIIG